LDTRNNGAFPLDPACPELLSIRSPAGLHPSFEGFCQLVINYLSRLITQIEHLYPCSVVGLAIVLLTSKISDLFCSNSMYKTETGIAKGRRLQITTHLDQSNHLANQHPLLGFALPFASLSIMCKNAGPKAFC
jgi:hypothetical protein